jgi:oxygen-dependent protoporphyrinogen oxidase
MCPAPKRVAVIGGGFAGLAAAHRIIELAPATQVVLFEASDRLGGVVRTEDQQGFLIEHGADMFTTREPWALDLCRRVGLADELINTNTEHARAFVLRRGRLYPVPEGFTLMTPGRFWPLARSGLLSISGKLRMAAEYFVPRRDSSADESLASFVTRRLGREAYERLVQPLIGGIYTADPTRLSMQAALPAFVDMERQHGSLIRAVRRSRAGGSAEKSAGARYGMFVAPRRGMESFVRAIASRLPPGSIHLQASVQSLASNEGNGWEIHTSGGNQADPFDAAIVATPAYRAAAILQAAAPQLARELDAIEYASAAIVALAFPRDQIKHPLDGFGLVVPQSEHRRILAASLSSVKFVGRAPAGAVLIRVFIGGACQGELVDLGDDELIQLAHAELRELLGVSGTPLVSRLIRWRRAMPQYTIGHLDRVAQIERELAGLPNLALAGNAYRGVGIPFCVHSGEQAAEKVVGCQLSVVS